MKLNITSSMTVMHKHALSLGIHPMLSLMIYQWELVNKKNSLIYNEVKVHKRSLALANFWFDVSSFYRTLAKNASGKPRTQFPMFCEQNVSATCKISQRKARAAIALTYKYLLVDKFYILLFFISMYMFIVFCFLFIF